MEDEGRKEGEGRKKESTREGYKEKDENIRGNKLREKSRIKMSKSE